jgi:hypothetical protein
MVTQEKKSGTTFPSHDIMSLSDFASAFGQGISPISTGKNACATLQVA